MSDYKQPTKGVSQAAEYSDNQASPAGLYRHPQTGAEVVTLSDPLYGEVQSEAFTRLGFEYVGEAPEGFVKTVVDPSTAYEEVPKANKANADDMKGLIARMNAVEAENARLKSQVESGNAVPGTEALKGADDTKQAAADKVAEQTGTQVDPATGQVVDTTAPVKTLSNQNKAELLETAAAEGVESPEQYDTNAKLVEAIQAKRDEADNAKGAE